MRKSIQLGAAMALSTLALLAAIGCAMVWGNHAGTQAQASAQVQERTCFPLSKWTPGKVPASARPCARILRVEEDGSVKVQVSNADGTFRYQFGYGAEDR